MEYLTKYRNVKNAGFALPAESGGRALKSAQHRENRKSCRMASLMEKRNALESDFTDNNDSKINNPKHEDRVTRFLKWKEEKQKRQLIEKEKRKPIFKVCHLSPKVREDVKSVRVTRSMAKAFSSVKSKIDTGLTDLQISKATRSTRKIGSHTNKLPTVYDFKPPKLKNSPQLTKPKGRNPNIKSTIKKSAKKQNNFGQIFPVKRVSMKDSTFFENKIKADEIIESPNSSKKTPVQKVKEISESKPVQYKTPARKLNKTYSEDELDDKKETTPQNETQVDTEIIYSPFVTTVRGKSSARKEWKLRNSIGIAPEISTPIILNTSIKTPSPQQEQLAAAKYFDTILDNEINRLLDECEKWNKIKEANDFPDNQELKDECDSVIGQTKLLVNNKFKQFRNLIKLCREGTGVPPVMNTDLQGFWDMIYMQVEKIDLSYKKLGDLQKNNWKDETVIKPIKKKPTTNAKKSTKVIPSRIKAAIQAARQKKALQQNESTNTFDGVFFSVRTPQKPELPSAITPSRSSVRNTLRVSVLSAQAQKRAIVRLSSSPGLSVMRATSIAKSVEKEFPQLSSNLRKSIDLTENVQESPSKAKRRHENIENVAPNAIASPKDKSTKKPAIRRSSRISLKFDVALQPTEDSTANLIDWNTPKTKSNKKRASHQVETRNSTPNLIDWDSPKLKNKPRCSKRLSAMYQNTN